jgi:ABC-type oligopeptide transport system substrate-binding subunit
VLTLLGTLLAACRANPTRVTASPTPGLAASQTLRAALVAGPRYVGLPGLASLDPTLATSASQQEVASLLFDGLVVTDANLGVEPWGASNVAVSSDGLTYTFTLRPGQFFSDGTPVTASDYAFSLNRTLNPCSASPLSYYLFDIKNAPQYASQLCRNGTLTPQPVPPGPGGPVITTLIGTSIVPDDVAGTLTITLSHPTGYFLEALTAAPSYALDPALVGSATSGSGWTSHLADGATGRGTSGMYYLASHANGAGQLTLKPNPHWWGLAAGKHPRLTEIDLTLYDTAAQSAAAYAAGKVDIAYLPPNQPAQSSATPTPSQPDTHTVPLLATYVLRMNWTIPPMDNADAREALCLAIDRSALLRQVSAADATIQGMPSWHLVPAGMPGYNPGLTGPDGVTSTAGDPNAARAHWQKYVQSLGGKPVPTFSYLDLAGASWQAALGTALQSDWQSVLGISVGVQSQSGNLANGTDLSRGPTNPYSWQADYADPQDFLSLQYLPGSAYDVVGVNDSAATALMQGADRQPDQTVRMQEYQQAEQLLVREAAVCPLWQATETYQVRTWIRGWSLTGLGFPANDTWLATAIRQH